MWSLFATSRGWLSLELGHHTVVVCGTLWDGAAARVLLPFVPVVLENHPSFRVRIGPHTRPRTASSGIPITIVPRTRHCGRPVGGARRRTVNLHRQVVLELVSCGRSRTITVVRICIDHRRFKGTEQVGLLEVVQILGQGQAHVCEHLFEIICSVVLLWSLDQNLSPVPLAVLVARVGPHPQHRRQVDCDLASEASRRVSASHVPALENREERADRPPKDWGHRNPSHDVLLPPLERLVHDKGVRVNGPPRGPLDHHFLPRLVDRGLDVRHNFRVQRSVGVIVLRSDAAISEVVRPALEGWHRFCACFGASSNDNV
eukprot:m.198438 g.198438  ORF g.198438 m.198438 type:complete len:316 (-) comp25134_c0_seq2:504-1451(-)